MNPEKKALFVFVPDKTRKAYKLYNNKAKKV